MEIMRRNTDTHTHTRDGGGFADSSGDAENVCWGKIAVLIMNSLALFDVCV